MWLERTPGLEEDGFDFPTKFRAAVEDILQRDLEAVEVGVATITSIVSITTTTANNTAKAARVATALKEKK